MAVGVSPRPGSTGFQPVSPELVMLVPVATGSQASNGQARCLTSLPVPSENNKKESNIR